MTVSAPVLPAARISDEARIWLSSLLVRAPRDPAILAVVATGSAVRPVERSQDLDLLIVHSGSRPSLRPPPPIDVDVRFQALGGIESAIADSNEYLVWALTYGEPLFDRAGFWARLVESWDRRRPLPPVERSLSRARRASRYAAELRAMGDLEATAEQTLSALTHLAWARLLAQGVLPLSRPEIPDQLRHFGEADLADELETALARRPDPRSEGEEAARSPVDGDRRHQSVGG